MGGRPTHSDMPRPLLLALALLAAAPLAAQSFGPSNTEGLFLHLALDAQGVELDDDDGGAEAEGGGLALRAGYGFSPLFTLYGGLSGARLDGDRTGEYDFGAAEVGARLSFNRGSALRPYLDLALRGVTAEADDVDFELRGGALALGGGITYFLSPTVALDAALRLGGGRFDEVQVGRVTIDVDGDALEFGEGRLSVGITAYPFR